MNSRLQKQLEGLSARVAKLQQDFGVVEKAGTAANDPPVPSIDGQRDIIAELVARAVDRGNAQTRTALLRSPAFLTLMRSAEKDPLVGRVLVESILEAERVAGGPEEPEAEEPAEPYDHAAFAAAKERGRLLEMGREILARRVTGDVFDYRVAKQQASEVLEAAQVIADHLARGGKDVSTTAVAKAVADSKPGKEPMVDFGLQKSATDTTKVDVRSLGRPRRMNQSEVLR